MKNDTLAVTSALFHRVEEFVSWFLHIPLFHLYLYGPRFGNYGFWQGKEDHEICFELTHVSADHWRQHRLLCQDIIHNQFQAWIVILTVGLYLLFLRGLYQLIWLVVAYLWSRHQRKCLCHRLVCYDSGTNWIPYKSSNNSVIE